MTRIGPRYEPPGVPITLPGPPGDVLAPWRTHRARLRAFFGGLDADAWTVRSRCTEWSVMDVLHHLTSVTLFFGVTVHEARNGVATQHLASFDPKTTPNQMVQAMAGMDVAASLKAFDDAEASLDAELDALDDDAWLLPAEAPPGRVPVRLALNHALFDSWLHERDVALPLGVEPPVDPRETEIAGRYLLALAGGAAAGMRDGVVSETLIADIRATDPDLRFGVDARDGQITVTTGTAPEGAPVARGRAADILDLASGRAPAKPVDADNDAHILLGRLAGLLK